MPSQAIEPLLESKLEPPKGCCARCRGCCCGRVGFIIYAVLLLAYLLFWWSCSRWAEAYVDDLSKHSKLVGTKLGKVEYYTRGTAPWVLIFHGQLNGWDMCLEPLISDYWVNAGYGILCPSRPGYLRTPLPHMPYTTGEQADLAAALLDEMGVDKVFVWGGSAGGPEAAQFAARHPHKSVGLGLAVAVTMSKPEKPGSPMCCIDDNGNFPWYTNVMSYILSSRVTSWLIYAQGSNPGLAIDSSIAQMSNFTAEEAAKEKARILANSTLANSVVTLMVNGAMPFSARWPGNINDIANQNKLEIPLESIQCPTLAAYAKHDGENGVPLENGLAAQKRIPGSTLFIMEHAWHCFWLAPEWPEVQAKYIELAQTSFAKA